MTFQFHKGTIETSTPWATTPERHQFQFHKGTIETKLRMTRKTRKRHFNSIKVRLKLRGPGSGTQANTISIP